MNDLKCIELMLAEHEAYRKDILAEIVEEKRRKNYCNILMGKALTNERVANEKRLEILYLKRIQSIDKNFKKEVNTDVSEKIKNIWASSIITLLSKNERLDFRFRDFFDIDGKINICKMYIDISEKIENDIYGMELEVKKLKYKKENKEN